MFIKWERENMYVLKTNLQKSTVKLLLNISQIKTVLTCRLIRRNKSLKVYNKLTCLLTDVNINIHTSPVRREVTVLSAEVQLSFTNILPLTLLTAVGNLVLSVSGFNIVSLLTHKKVFQWWNNVFHRTSPDSDSDWSLCPKLHHNQSPCWSSSLLIHVFFFSSGTFCCNSDSCESGLFLQR